MNDEKVQQTFRRKQDEKENKVCIYYVYVHNTHIQLYKMRQRGIMTKSIVTRAFLQKKLYHAHNNFREYFSQIPKSI